jgi:outer membrane protein OmpA-like peptidoglycan-associated protein
MKKTIKYVLSIMLFASCQYVVAQKGKFEQRTKLSDQVNSDKDESALMLSPDGKTMYFVRSFHPENIGGENGNQDIWMSTVDNNGNWSKATPMPQPVNDKWHNAVYGSSADGNMLFVSNQYDANSNKRVYPGISIVRKQGNTWSAPQAISTSFQFPREGFFGAAVYDDGNVLIVSFKGKDTKGNEDLYVMRRDANGSYGDPVNIGEVINTSGFETSPFIAPDGKTLYFSSNGHGGYGDGDIYNSTRLDDTWLRWSKPENLGPKVNTSGFEGSYCIDKAGMAYFISGDTPSSPGDIFTINTIQPPPDTAGDYARRMAALRAKREREIQDSIAAALAAKPKPEQTDVFGRALFAFDSYILTPKSKKDLQIVVKKMKGNKQYKISVEGHTDAIGSEEYNQKLSERRAASVKKFLIQNGVQAKRIESRGFGELNPIADNDTEEGRAENRRVEVKYFR